VPPANHPRLVLFCSVIFAASCIAGCAAAFGPGYSIDKQEIRVEFRPGPQPIIDIEAEYRLRNTGNRPLTSLELRLPGRRRFHFANPSATWDGQTAAFAPLRDNPRNVELALPEPWTISASHTLRLSVQYQPPESGESTLSFSPDAFFLPAEGWSPQLLPARGIFATGGVPPEKWVLTLRAPDEFLVHMSGRQRKRSRGSHEQTIRAEQHPQDGYPFVISGRYFSTRLKAGEETVNLWSRGPQDSATLRPATSAFLRTVQAYNVMFGERAGGASRQLWIVECPVIAGCFSGTASNYAKLIGGGDQSPSAEMASLDSVMLDLTSGPPELAAAAAPSLASSWLGYGQNPGFYEQEPPLSALPAFAASRGREAVQGPQVRTETIRRVLQVIPAQAEPQKTEGANIVRAKSLLFFYALQDRYGQDVCNKALSHMLYARRGGGFNLSDLISAFEQEVHQNVAEFVRRWMKHPGVPDDFRARYENASAARAVDTTVTSATNKKENMP